MKRRSSRSLPPDVLRGVRGQELEHVVIRTSSPGSSDRGCLRAGSYLLREGLHWLYLYVSLVSTTDS